MPERHPSEAAESILRDVGHFPTDEQRIPPVDEVLAAIEQFAAIDFDVPRHPEADSLLFQFTTMTTYAGGTFVIGFTRQFEVEDDEGEHECFVHVRCDYRYPIDPDVEAAGNHAQWWHRAEPEPLTDWLRRAADNPIWRILADKTPSAFVIRQETV
jgi:hypothetical protein